MNTTRTTLLVFLTAVLVLPYTLSAQKKQYLTRADSDPKALSLIDHMNGLLKKDRLQIDFGMSVAYPSEKPVNVKGIMIQQGDKFRISTDTYQIWCDGASRWVYDPDAQEVNLYSAKRNGDDATPVALFAEFTGDEYIAAWTGNDEIRKIPVEVIELKPVDRDSEIAKLRLSVQKDGKPVRLEIMEKQGSRTTLDVYKTSTPDKQSESYFVFNKSEYPDAHVEDLRID